MIVVVLLLILGIVFIYSAGAGQGAGSAIGSYWKKQILWVAAGTCAMILIGSIDYQAYGRYVILIYFFTTGLLVLVLIIGFEVYGAKSWIKLPGFTIQPSEFAKLGTIIALGWVASFPSTRVNNIFHIIAISSIVLIPMMLILLQPDMGSAMVFIPILAAILFIGGIYKRYIIFTIIFVLLAGPITYKVAFAKHQKTRVLTYLKPLLDEGTYDLVKSFSGVESGKRGSEIDDWNAVQSELAVGSGGMWGKGLTKGTQNTLGFLPNKVTPTDFIHSLIAEEMGFVGSITLLTLLVLLVVIAIYIGVKARDQFGQNVAIGIAVMLAAHIFINIGMTIRVMPIIGIPLPLVSYGGSSIILVMCCIGVLQSIYVHRYDAKK